MMAGLARYRMFLLLVGATVTVAVAQRFLGNYALSVIEITGIYVILAVSLTLTNGFTGLFSLGHPAFMALGGYATALLTMAPVKKQLLLPDLPGWLLEMPAWPFLPSLLLAGAVGVLVAVLVGLPVLRLKGHYLAVATIGLIYIIASLATSFDQYTRGSLGLYGLPELTGIWWVYAWVVITIYTAWRLKSSSLGRAMFAIRGDELAASCVGVRTTRLRLLAFCLGAFFAAVAGSLWTHIVTVITPASFDVMLAFELVVMIVIGGWGSITGAVVAAVGLTALNYLLRPLEEGLGLYGFSQVVVAVLVLFVLIYRPGGLLGSREVGRSLRA